jgi:murein DD-endopeptidase MepM/ murein hydrolase activator NlpD
VTVTSVWTTDGSGNNKTTFNCGDSIRYYGNVYNNTGSSKTAYFSWSVTGPCGSIASWSGNQTTANGNAVWYLPATIPSNACAGTYTYKLSVTYGGSTSYKSINFTVNCGGGWRLPWQGSWSFTGGPHVYGIWPSSPCNQLTNGVPSGLDFSGGSVVLAIDAGTVVTASSGLEGFCGYDVKIKHGSYIVGYMHMKSPAQGGVQWTVGQTVQQGTKVGVTGGCSPVHLHLELYDVNGGRVSWDGMRIDGYAVHVVRRISDGQIHNYEGSMTKGTEDPRTVTMCGNYGQATLVLAPETAIAGTAEPGCYGGICRTRQVTSTNTLRP